MINEAKQRLTDNKVFPKNVREVLRAYNFTGISEETEEFLNLQTIFKCLVKKTDAEKFYSMFYSTVPIKSAFPLVAFLNQHTSAFASGVSI